jgi:hypothetical protein
VSESRIGESDSSTSPDQSRDPSFFVMMTGEPAFQSGSIVRAPSTGA